jgi:DNA-binding CsgD family transcriptional regulator
MLSNRDLVRALQCVGELLKAKDHEQFVATLVRTMHPLLNAKVTGYNEADPSNKRFAFVIHPREFVTDKMITAWVTYAHQNPLLMHCQNNPTDFSVHKITDFVPQKEFRKTELCRQLYKQMEAEYQIALPFPIPGSASIAIVFNRDRDYGPRDKELLTLLQPMVCSAYLNIQKMTDLQFSQEQLQAAVNSRHGSEAASIDQFALSGRQRDVLGKLIDGKSNKQIAEDLKLSIRTVEKYVEQLLRKLNVPTRAAASAKFRNVSLNGHRADLTSAS